MIVLDCLVHFKNIQKIYITNNSSNKWEANDNFLSIFILEKQSTWIGSVHIDTGVIAFLNASDHFCSSE